jgi:hypothetical protein
MPSEAQEGGRSLAQRFEAVRLKVLDAIASGEHRSANAVYRAIGGTKAEVLEAVRELLGEGAIAKVGGVIRVVEKEVQS